VRLFTHASPVRTQLYRSLSIYQQPTGTTIGALKSQHTLAECKVLLSQRCPSYKFPDAPVGVLCRTGFEEEKDFPVQLNAVVAGRYHVTEYLGSAAFSKAIQAHDLQTGMDVCMKIIKNNKDFFDQSLDEIKLLKYINKHDPADEHHILRLYDYFYHRVSALPGGSL
jgi:hypothetical protein